MEATLTGSPIDTSNTDDLEVDEEENADESITKLAKSINEMENYLEEENKTEAYQETMNIYIENIDRI